MLARCGFRHVENVFGRQRSHQALQPAAIERGIGIHSFMQNKPNFPDVLMNITSLITADYENKSNWTLGENEPKTNPIRTQYEPNSNPIKANLPEGKIDAKCVVTKDYEEKCG